MTDQDLGARFTRETEPLYEALARGARRLARSDADADDLLQDTLLHAYAGFHTFREGSNLKAWLFRILYNRWVSAHRAKQRRPPEISVDALTEHELAYQAVRLPHSQRSAETEVLDALPDIDIETAMAALPEGFREVVYYADIQGYTYAETAELMNIPMGTVMSRASRARNRLRTALTQPACIA
ncbi:sigma-70 family RNA polymerase sigma factor [Mycolicibacterium pulveris]|uniref:RNA polymerase sigma factor n=1 Tax=Mycolicibacterium pulveris TaxID=36813 RepID=A0A7I7UII2_MYCPV|nr:sigma-70 family RNA polymerase sigma factor [Mycolicibacterium pulveris]MCV6979272.1 sigma-70 family RNA polymerase sigma factor [Mycolicibacterium pulveris]BBY81288.1 RNA polymerase sigma factor [Mycolicibacterium pulveris]